jgi:hypothetical protein
MIPFTLGWFTLPVLGIDEIPLLVSLAVEFAHIDISIFSINCTGDFHDFAFFLGVSEEWSFPFEELEPS